MGDLDLYKVLDIFLRFDLNDNGTIEIDELTAVLRKLDPGGWPDKRIEQLWASMDVDRSEHVNYEEFLKWVWGEKDYQDVDSLLLRHFMKVVDPAASEKGQTGQPEAKGPLMKGVLDVQRKRRRDPRYFVLEKEKLEYYCNAEDLEAGNPPRGRLMLDDIEELEEEEDGFKLTVTGGQVLHLKVSDPTELQKWIGKLQSLLDLEDEEPLLRGVLSLQTSKSVTERYFLLYTDRLEYFTDAEDAEAGGKPRGCVMLQDVEELVKVDDGFNIRVSGRLVQLRVGNPHELQKWLNKLDELLDKPAPELLVVEET